MSGGFPLSKRLIAEGAGTTFLLMAVVGSGIMGERLAAGNAAIVLLANSTATGCTLAVLIQIFAPISGAHFNPAVTLCMAIQKRIAKTEALAYIGVQVISAVCGVMLAHIMFGEPLLSASEKIRTGGGQWISEFIATFGLLMVISGCMKNIPTATPWAVATYITAAYWFTASTSFANPAVTIARAFTNTFAGIRPEDVFPFILAQIAGAVVAMLFTNFFTKK